MVSDYRSLLTSLAAVAVFTAVHLEAPRLYGYSEQYKRTFLSLAGGIASAYVFLDLMPLLQGAGHHFTRLFGATAFARLFLEKAVFGVAFIGFLTFFLMERLAYSSRRRAASALGGGIEAAAASKPLFAIHIGLTALLSLVISYSLRHEVSAGVLKAVLYTVALSLHFTVSDRSMEEHYRDLYVRYGRYILAAMPLIGWGISFLDPEHLSESYVAMAFIAGAVLFNVIKDEVPRAERGRSSFFFLGAVTYAALVLVLTRLG